MRGPFLFPILFEMLASLSFSFLEQLRHLFCPAVWTQHGNGISRVQLYTDSKRQSNNWLYYIKKKKAFWVRNKWRQPQAASMASRWWENNIYHSVSALKANVESRSEKKKNENQSRFVTTRITKACGWRCCRALQSGVGGYRSAFWMSWEALPRCHSEHPRPRLGSRKERFAVAETQGLPSDWTIKSSGSRQSAAACES